MVVILNAVFVPDHLTVQFVYQFINRGIEVSVGAFGEHIGAFDVNAAFGSLPEFFFLLLFDGEEDFDIDDLVEMSNDTIKFGRDIAAQGGGNFKMVTADRQVHK